VATLQIPLSIWLGSTPEERDQFYLDAGFDPNLPVVDNGTDTTTVRFRQDVPVVSMGTPVVMDQTPINTVPQSGDDLRNFQAFNLLSTTDEMGIAQPVVAGTYAAIAGRALKQIMGGGGGRLTSTVWNSLPSLVRTSLTQLGLGVGAMVAFNGDIPFITLPGQGESNGPNLVPFGPPVPPATGAVDIQIGGIQGVSIIGSWNTNPSNPSQGVTFYRLSDGKLAVQNKKGRWKVWKPKKPIVLYANGASDLKTMLRADKALNRQAKRIAAMLNRRAPRRRSGPGTPTKPIILGNSNRVVDV
jgi:hypothetical protein